MLRSDILISLPVDKFVDYDNALGIDLDKVAADVAVFNVPFKCQVVQAALLITETCAGTTPGVVAMDHRPTAGSDASRGVADIANFAMGTTVAGKHLYDLVAVGTVLEPGEQVVVEIVTQPVTGPAGHFHPILLVQQMPETQANLSNTVVTA